MSFLEDKEEKNGIKMISYASGDGSLSLAFEIKSTRKISEVKVTNRDVEAFIKREGLAGWKPYYNGGSFSLYHPVERISADEVLYNGKSFRYAKVHEQCFHIFDEEGNETKNGNIDGAIRFFVNHESELL